MVGRVTSWSGEDRAFIGFVSPEVVALPVCRATMRHWQRLQQQRAACNSPMRYRSSHLLQCSICLVGRFRALLSKAFAMTAITVSPRKSERSPWRILAPLLRALHVARQQDRVARELSLLSDRELADFGLSRGDIPAVARGEFRR